MEPTLSPARPEPLSFDECLRLLELRQAGCIAFIRGEQPEILPMTYRFSQGTVVVRTACDIDLDAVHGQPVALEIDDTDEGARTGWSVVVYGKAEEIWDSEEPSDIRELPLRLWASGHREHYLRILPTAITGRRVGHDGDHNLDLVGRPEAWYG